MTALVVRPAEPVSVQPATCFDRVSMAFHWITVLVVAWMFASAWSIGLARDAAGAARMLSVHRSAGVALWAITAGRLAWAVTRARRPLLPADLPRVQKLAARVNEGALYAILLLQPLTGLAQSLARGRPFILFGLEVPRLMARDKAAASLLHGVHELTANLLLGLVALHIAAALFHGLVRRDGVLSAMLPVRRA